MVPLFCLSFLSSFVSLIVIVSYLCERYRCLNLSAVLYCNVRSDEHSFFLMPLHLPSSSLSPTPFLFTPYYPVLPLFSPLYYSSLTPTLFNSLSFTYPIYFVSPSFLPLPLLVSLFYTSSSTQNTTLLYTSLSSWCIVNEFYRNRDTARYTARHVIYYLLLHFHFNYKN